MIDKALLAKIRKCLALSASSNENEAAAALAKARELMAEHGVSDADLAMAEIEEATARGNRAFNPPAWENVLAHVVCEALGVRCIIETNLDWKFIGRGPSADIASYAFAALHRRLKRARADYIAANLKRCRPGRKRARADMFCEGWALALSHKVAALAPQRPSDPLIEQWLEVRYPGLVVAKTREAKAKDVAARMDRLRGAREGADVDLHHGVGGSADERLALQ